MKYGIQMNEGNRNGYKLVSIVISNYNGKKDLKNCLASLARLEYPAVEVIVVDSGSTDGAPNMVENEFPDVHLIREERIGIGEAINIGISKAKGDIIIFDLNNDDIVSRNWLNPLVKHLTNSPEIGVVCGKRYMGKEGDMIDSAGDKIWLGVPYAIGHGKKDSAEYNVVREVDSAPVIATRRDVIEEVGLLDEEYYIYGEDVDFCLRARKLGYKILYIPNSVLYHQVSSTIGEYSPRRLYYNVRCRILLIQKHYSFCKKMPLMFFHLFLLPFLNVLYYYYFTKDNFYSYVKSQVRGIIDGLKHRLTIY